MAITRPTLSPEQLQLIADKRTELGTQPTDAPNPGTNLVQDDWVQIDNSWYAWIVAPDSGCTGSYIPDWDLYLSIGSLEDYISDRAGPNGETMPIFDPVEAQARAAAKPAGDPKHAAKGEQHAPRRALQQVLREAIKRLPHNDQKRARQTLRQAGVLGPEDKED